MNEQATKKILFNKSSLLNLKAELLKKHEEVLKKKQLPHNKLENFKPPPPKATENETSNTKVKKKNFKDSLKAVDTEELEAHKKSKLALEKKAELYEHLADSAGQSELAGRYLVDFENKKFEVRTDSKNDIEQRSPESQKFDIIDTATDNGEEWTEFTDCLGRTRKCHKSDIDMFRQRDQDLMKIVFKDQENSGESSKVDKQEMIKDKPLLVQKTNDYLLSLRQKWEEKEREMLAKDKDIHYQDLLFDEARIHGVGYYAFSTDENERRKQMDELMKEREATLNAQKQAEEARRKREEIVAARVKAARARQRLRAGLPPEDPEENQKDFTTHLLEFLTKQRNEVEEASKEKEKKEKEEQEKERQKLRDTYVREWDVGKQGVEDKVKRFREMSQEEYVEQQRSKRINEFAPPKASSSKQASRSFDNHGKIVADEGPKSWSDVRPLPEPPLPPIIGDLTELKGLYFSTKKQNTVFNESENSLPIFTDTSSQVDHVKKYEKTKDFKYRNFVKAQEVVPIVNEVSDEEPDGRGEPGTRTATGPEVAPPPTYDYYGPISKRQKFNVPFKSDMGEAFAQGTKSLQAKGSAREISKDYDFMFN